MFLMSENLGTGQINFSILLLSSVFGLVRMVLFFFGLYGFCKL